MVFGNVKDLPRGIASDKLLRNTRYGIEKKSTSVCFSGS